MAGARPYGTVGPPDMASGIEVQTEPVRLPGEASVASKATAFGVRRARPPAESGTARSPAPVSRAPANWSAQHSPSMTSVVPHPPDTWQRPAATARSTARSRLLNVAVAVFIMITLTLAGIQLVGHWLNYRLSGKGPRRDTASRHLPLPVRHQAGYQPARRP